LVCGAWLGQAPHTKTNVIKRSWYETPILKYSILAPASVLGESETQMSKTIVVLEGDQTGQELLEEALRVLDPGVIGVDLRFERFDLSLEQRRTTHNQVVHAAAEAMLQAGLGLKAATITPEAQGDVGSPNAILREHVDGTVIVRTGRRIPGVRPVGGVYAPISVIRMAVGDAYGAKEWREGQGLDEVAYRTEHITRRHCRAVSEYAFRHAAKLHAKVFGGPKYTVSPVYEGMLKEEMDEAAHRHPGVKYDPQLIDATYALLLGNMGDAMVIPTLNRDGDCMSDLVLQMFGSIAGSESLLLGFDDQWNTRVVMAEAPHGTAPALFGKNLANPMAMILAGGSLLSYIGGDASIVARAISEAVFEAVYDGVRTADLQGHATTSAFTDEVIKRVRTKLAVWPSISSQ
jgi:isocitrate/isopropylmalate dehydrogenase